MTKVSNYEFGSSLKIEENYQIIVHFVGDKLFYGKCGQYINNIFPKFSNQPQKVRFCFYWKSIVIFGNIFEIFWDKNEIF